MRQIQFLMHNNCQTYHKVHQNEANFPQIQEATPYLFGLVGQRYGVPIMLIKNRSYACL